MPLYFKVVNHKALSRPSGLAACFGMLLSLSLSLLPVVMTNVNLAYVHLTSLSFNLLRLEACLRLDNELSHSEGYHLLPLILGKHDGL